MRSFKFWSFLGLLSTEINSVSAAPGSGAKLDRGEHSEGIHSPSFWSGDPKTHAYTWESERTSFSPSTRVWYTDTTVTHATTICPPSPGNSTVIASDVSTISWKLTSTTTYSTTLTYEQSSITTSPPPNPCPTSCKVSAGTVNLFYWPTNQPYDYPTTYFDEHLDYTL
ncbi:hypothetical protein N7481_013119 [Penicillium waksmanii]|uniref:uncharacterized protein n=1 Tax=Penicillium waksmanii TaxID=69791 RepID=UPI002547266F|nr:uncharacterized protein N7481_013119 [Penicillium waksmanii]KAJ5966405.1 hypothetical protein N7481_013119 [Penicillium waksmanii]